MMLNSVSLRVLAVEILWVVASTLLVLQNSADKIAELLPIIINAVLAIVSVGYWISSRRESKSKIKTQEVDTIDKLMERNTKLFEQLEVERQEKMDAINRISGDLSKLSDSLSTTNRMLAATQESLSNAMLRVQNLDEENRRYKTALSDSFVKQGELQQQLEKHGVTIEAIKKQTAELHLPARDEKKLPPS